MKFKVIIFCVLVFCSQIVVPFPFEEEEVRQRAHQTNGWPVDHNTPQYHHTNFARTQNAPPAHHQNYNDNFGTQDRNYDNYEYNSHTRAPTKERKPFRNPINRPQEFDHPNWRPHTQFANPVPLLPAEKRYAIRNLHSGADPNPAFQGHFSPPGDRPYRNIDRNSNFPIPRTHQRDFEQFPRREQFPERPSLPRREHYLNREKEHIRPIRPNLEHPIPNNSPPHSGFNKHYAREPVAFAEAGFPHEGIPIPLPVHEPNRGHRTKDIPASSSPVRRRNAPHFSGYDKPFEPTPEGPHTGFSRDIIPKHPDFPVDPRGHPTTRDHTRYIEDIPVQHKKYAPPSEFTEPIGRKSEYPHEAVAKPHRVPNDHKGHHHKDIQEKMKEILESSHKRFVIVHPNGTVENLDKIDPATQHNPNSHTIYAKPDGTIEYEDHNGRINPEDYVSDKRDDHDNNHSLKKVFNPVSEKHHTDNIPDDHDSNITKIIDPIPEKHITDYKPDGNDNNHGFKNKMEPVPDNHPTNYHHDENDKKHDLKKIFETILEKYHADDIVPNHQSKMAEIGEHLESTHNPLKDMDVTTVSSSYHSENSSPPHDSVKSHDDTPDEIITSPPEELSTDNVKDISTVTESVIKPHNSAINATLEIIKTLTTETPIHQNDNLNKSAIITTQSTIEIDLNVTKGKDTVDVNDSTLSSESNKNLTLASKDTTEVNATNIHITDNRQTTFATTDPVYNGSVANNSKFENSSSFLDSTHVTDNYQTTTTTITTTSAPEHYDTVTNHTTLNNSSTIVDHIINITTPPNDSANETIDYNKSFVRPATNDSNTNVDDHGITDDSVTVTTSSPLPSDVHTVSTAAKTSTASPINSTLDSKQPKDVTITLSIPANNKGDTVSVSVDIPPEDADDHSEPSEDETLVVNISTKNTTVTSTAKPCASDGNQNSDKNVVIDLSVTQEKPVIWVRTTDENILDKLSAGNDKVVYFFNVGPQTLVNRDTTKTVFENGTTIIDITETIYEHKDDKSPKIVKTTQIINP